MPVYKKASARGQLQPRHADGYQDDDQDDNAVTRFQRRSPLPGAPIAARIAQKARPQNRSIDDEAMTVLLDRASLFPPARSKDVRVASSAPVAPTAPRTARAPIETSEPPPTLTRPRMAMPARVSSPPPLPPARPSAPVPAVTISQPPASVSGARSRVAADTERTRRQGMTKWRVAGALAVLLVGGSVGAVITSVVARGRATIAAEPLPALPARAMDLAPPPADPRALGATAACAVGDLAGATAPADRANAGVTATGTSTRHGTHRGSSEASVARHVAGSAMGAADAGADAEAVGQDDFAAAAEALSKAQLETTLP
jgi:hypothetical protein